MARPRPDSRPADRPPDPPAQPLDLAFERTLRGFAFVGAVIVAALAVFLRTRRGEETTHNLDTGLAEADHVVDRESAVVDPTMERLGALVDRVLSRWLS